MSCIAASGPRGFFEQCKKTWIFLSDIAVGINDIALPLHVLMEPAGCFTHVAPKHYSISFTAEILFQSLLIILPPLPVRSILSTRYIIFLYCI